MKSNMTSIKLILWFMVISIFITSGMWAKGDKDSVKHAENVVQESVLSENPYSWAEQAAKNPLRAEPPATSFVENFDKRFPDSIGRETPPEKPDRIRQMPSNGVNGVAEGNFPNRREPPRDFNPAGGNFFLGKDSTATASEPVNNKSTRNIVDSSLDLVEEIEFELTVFINLDTNEMNYNGSAWTDDSSVSLETVDNGLLFNCGVSAPVQVILSGELDGTLNIVVPNSSTDLAIFLDGVEITAYDGAALNIDSENRVFIVIAENSQNILTDSANRSKGNKEKGAIFSTSAIVISAESGEEEPTASSGGLVVNGNYRNGIYSDDYIRLRSGLVAVNVSARDGIRCINGFIMDSGDLTIEGTGVAIDDESKGIKVDGKESQQFPGEGFVLIQGGRLTITTAGKGITASWEAEDDAETESTTDDPNANVTINGGIIDIITTTEPYEYTQEDGTDVSCSPEGIEAKNLLTVNDGNISIWVADDGLNAGRSIVINGGSIYIESTQNDAIDSNGSLEINGGNIAAIGAGGAECAFDCDNNNFPINGGTILGQGGSNITMPAKTSTQNVFVIYQPMAEGQIFGINDSEGNTVFEYQIPISLETLIVSLPTLENGSFYSFFVDSVEFGSVTTGIATVNAVTTLGEKSFGRRF